MIVVAVAIAIPISAIDLTIHAPTQRPLATESHTWKDLPPAWRLHFLAAVNTADERLHPIPVAIVIQNFVAIAILAVRVSRIFSISPTMASFHAEANRALATSRIIEEFRVVTSQLFHIRRNHKSLHHAFGNSDVVIFRLEGGRPNAPEVVVTSPEVICFIAVGAGP